MSILLKNYEFVRTPENNLLLVAFGFRREAGRDEFLASLEEEGLRLKRQDDTEVHLSVIKAEISTSIIDQENLVVEIDSSLDETGLL